MHVNERLHVIVFGESLLNDGVAVVVYRICVSLAYSQSTQIGSSGLRHPLPTILLSRLFFSTKCFPVLTSFGLGGRPVEESFGLGFAAFIVVFLVETSS